MEIRTINAFVISSVRDIQSEEYEQIAEYVANLENAGEAVYWPGRPDTDQNDPVGIRICQDNFTKIIEAPKIHVWFNPVSKGSVFDFGGVCMLLACGCTKKIVFANKTGFEKDAAENTFTPLHGNQDRVTEVMCSQTWLERVLRTLDCSGELPRDIFGACMALRNSSRINFVLHSKDTQSLFQFGGIFMLRVLRSSQEFFLANKKEIEAQAIPGAKSFENVALALFRGEKVSVNTYEKKKIIPNAEEVRL